MDVTTETYQAFLDDAWDAAPEQAETLRSQLRIYEKAITTLFSQGAISSISKNSVQQTYRGPGLGSYTMQQLQTVWRTLINLFDRTKEEIICRAKAKGEEPDTTDDAIIVIMRRWLNRGGPGGITEVQADMTHLRLPTPAIGIAGVTW